MYHGQPVLTAKPDETHEPINQETDVTLRVVACAPTFVFLRFIERTLTHLGNQPHAIRVRTFDLSFLHDVSMS
jgi:hypothetical protein